MNELENVSDSSDLSDYSPSDDDSELEEDESPIPYENFARIVDLGKLVFVKSPVYC